MIKKYLYNWGVLLSQALSVLLGGHPDDSISERTARAYLSRNGQGWFATQLKIIDFIVYVMTKEKNHCLNSLNDEVRAVELWNWDKK
jgi:hypothetical protein